MPNGGFTDFAAGSGSLTGWTVVGVDVAIVSTNYPNMLAQSGSQWLDLMGVDQGGGHHRIHCDRDRSAIQRVILGWKHHQPSRHQQHGRFQGEWKIRALVGYRELS